MKTTTASSSMIPFPQLLALFNLETYDPLSNTV